MKMIIPISTDHGAFAVSLIQQSLESALNFQKIPDSNMTWAQGERSNTYTYQCHQVERKNGHNLFL